MNLQDILALLGNNNTNNNAGNLDLNQIQQLLNLVNGQTNNNQTNANQGNLDPATLQMMLQQKQQPAQPAVDTDFYDDLTKKILTNAENIKKFNGLVDNLLEQFNELNNTVNNFIHGTNNKTYVTRKEYSTLKNTVDQHQTDIDHIKRWKGEFDNRLMAISNDQRRAKKDFSSLETKVKTALDLKDDNEDYQYDPQLSINPEDALTGDTADVVSMFDGIKRKQAERESKDAYDRQRMAQANIDAQTTVAVTDEQKQDNLTAKQTVELEHEAQKHDSLHEVDEMGHEMDRANEEIEEKNDNDDFLKTFTEAESDKATDHMVEDQVDDRTTEDKTVEKDDDEVSDETEEKTEVVEERKPMTDEQRAMLRKQAGIIDEEPKDGDKPDKGDALSALGI